MTSFSSEAAVRGSPSGAQDGLLLADVSRGAQWVLSMLVLLIGATGVALHVLAMQPPTLPEGPALETAVCGELLASGQGLRTRAIHPLTIGLGLGSSSQPMLTQGPVVPALLSAYFRVRGQSDIAVRLCSTVALWVCLIGVVILGARLYDLRAGLVAGALLAVNPFVADLAVSGDPSLWAAAWFLLALAIALRPGEGDPQRAVTGVEPPVEGRLGTVVRAFAAGLCMGLCYLSDLQTLPLLLVLAIPVWQRATANRRLSLALLALGFAALAVPWWIRNALVTGDVFFSLPRYTAFFGSPAYPSSTVLGRATDPGSPYLFLLTHPRHLFQLLVSHTWGLAVRAPALLGVIVLPLAFASLFVRSESSRERAVRSGALLGLCLLALWTLPSAPNPTTYLAVLPLLIVQAALLLLRLLAGQTRTRRVAIACAIALVSVSPIGARRLGGASPMPAPSAVALAETGTKVPEETVLLTATPGQGAWYAKRTSVSLPVGAQDLRATLALIGDRPVALFVSRDVLLMARSAGARFYQGLLMGPGPSPGLQEVHLETRAGRLFLITEPEAIYDMPARGPTGGVERGSPGG